MPHRWRWVLLLSASYYFYMCWRPAYIILILSSTLVGYACALYMEHPRIVDRNALRRMALVVSLIVNLGILFVFKYYNFASRLLHDLVGTGPLAHLLPTFHVLLPAGSHSTPFRSSATRWTSIDAACPPSVISESSHST